MSKRERKTRYSRNKLIMYFVVFSILCSSVPVQANPWREAAVDVTLSIVVGGVTKRTISNPVVAFVVSNAGQLVLKEMIFRDPETRVLVKLNNVCVGKVYVAERVKYIVLSVRENLRKGSKRLVGNLRILKYKARDAAPVVADKLRTLKYKARDVAPVVADKLRTLKYKARDAAPVVADKLRTLKYKARDAAPVVADKLRTAKYKAQNVTSDLTRRIKYFFRR